MLKVENVDSGYDFLQVLWGINIEINRGEFVALIGPNGAGKTTTLRTISGLLKPKGGRIFFKDELISNLPPYEITHSGLSYVSEDLNLFVNMPVYENLLMGAYIIKDEKKIKQTMEYIYELFPRLAERKKQLAGTLSGGERKMLAIARGMMSNPEMLLVDEPSLGLAPYLVRNVFDALKTLHGEGLTILLVEQNVNATLDITDRAYIIEQGKIVLSGKSKDLARNEHVQNVYLGI
ncbi:MAG: branched-chain amino acid ABC transporter ATP-binding protein [Spirochaetes bacterium]|nr:MAG: branched-chain amino acid ABC transporter ATP-binding protein [Spirochaetota bacterium]